MQINKSKLETIMEILNIKIQSKLEDGNITILTTDKPSKTMLVEFIYNMNNNSLNIVKVHNELYYNDVLNMVNKNLKMIVRDTVYFANGGE